MWLLSAAQYTLPGMASTAAYSTPLGDLTTVELLDAAKQIRELQQSPGWALLTRLLGEHAGRLEKQLLSVSLPSHEKMAALAGELRGLKAMGAAAETVLAEAQAREAKEQQRVEDTHV